MYKDAINDVCKYGCNVKIIKKKNKILKQSKFIKCLLIISS